MAPRLAYWILAGILMLSVFNVVCAIPSIEYDDYDDHTDNAEPVHEGKPIATLVESVKSFASIVDSALPTLANNPISTTTAPIIPTTLQPTTTTEPPNLVTTIAPPINNMTACVRCLCHHLSACDNTVCDPSVDLCDLWQITYTVWRSSGSPMIADREYPNPISAFEHCRSDEACALRTISAYIEMHKADCNGDGTVDCLDVTIIHTGGPEVCQNWPKSMIPVGIAECMAGTQLTPNASSADEADDETDVKATAPEVLPVTIATEADDE